MSGEASGIGGDIRMGGDASQLNRCYSLSLCLIEEAGCLSFH